MGKKLLDTRKTSNDYRRELRVTEMKLESIKNHVSSRLLELSSIHPEAIVTQQGGTDIKARGITKNWIERLTVYEQLVFIQMIENNTKNLHGRQTSIDD